MVEAQRLNKLSLNHSGIVRVNESFRANGTAYYVMEYIKGQSLRDYVKHSPQCRLSEEDALQLFRPIANAIGYLHANMITHLDIKPDNILIRESGDPVVIDFGLSKHYSSKGTPTSTIKAAGCSAGYSPMEQYAGITTFSPKADVYALGGTLLYMLTGKDPVMSTEIKSDYVANVLSGIASEPVIVAISHAMAKLSEDRTHSVSALVSDLTGNDSNRMDEPIRPQTQHDDNKTKKKRRVTPGNSMKEGCAVKNPIEAIRVAFKRMFDFTGRSSRSEFWWIFLLLALVQILLIFISDIDVVISEWDLKGGHYWLHFNPITVFPIIVVLFTISLQIRRLHDIGICGKWAVFFNIALLSSSELWVFIHTLFRVLMSSEESLQSFWLFWVTFIAFIMILFAVIFALPSKRKK